MMNTTILILQYTEFAGALFIQWSRGLAGKTKFNNKTLKFFMKKKCGGEIFGMK